MVVGTIRANTSLKCTELFEPTLASNVKCMELLESTLIGSVCN